MTTAVPCARRSCQACPTVPRLGLSLSVPPYSRTRDRPLRNLLSQNHGHTIAIRRGANIRYSPRQSHRVMKAFMPSCAMSNELGSAVGTKVAVRTSCSNWYDAYTNPACTNCRGSANSCLRVHGQSPSVSVSFHVAWLSRAGWRGGECFAARLKFRADRVSDGCRAVRAHSQCVFVDHPWRHECDGEAVDAVNVRHRCCCGGSLARS